jgi:NAD(P)-dependent dehydrogenase (short-subunit alcohol dehydrogenase family)
VEANKIIITGAATRVGAAIAMKLAGPNKEIVIHYNKSKTQAENLKKNLIKKNAKVFLVQGNLTKEKDIDKIINFAKKKLKNFDCLINNASLFENDKITDFTSKSWDAHINANLKAPALLIKKFSKFVSKETIILLILLIKECLS